MWPETYSTCLDERHRCPPKKDNYRSIQNNKFSYMKYWA